jgi:hypothetical protein
VACRRWELRTGLLVVPVAGPPGTPPEIIRQASPFWQAIMPESHPDADKAGGNKADKQSSAVGTDSTAVGSGVQIDTPLSARQLNILEALYLLGAFDADTRQTTEEIAVKAEGKGVDPAGFKEPIAELGSLKLVETKRGRSGGCWLTGKGRERAERRQKK